MSRSIFIWFLLFNILLNSAYAQSINDIKRGEERTEKEIAYLNKLLLSTRNDKSQSLNKIAILKEKVAKGREMIVSLNSKMKHIEKEIEDNQNRRVDFEKKRGKIVDFYSKMVYESWKKRGSSDIMIAIFTSINLSQAYSRYKYFEQIESYSKHQLQNISLIDDSLSLVNTQLFSLLEEQNRVQSEIVSANNYLSNEQEKLNISVVELKKKEKDIDKKLKAEIANREKYKRELLKLVDNKIRQSGSSTSKFNLTPEDKLVSDDFVKNRGRLPWPVEEGFISEKFGINTPIYAPLVKINNDGVNITTISGSDVRSVFKGVVTEIMFIPGQNNVICIRHGNYLTLYNNIVEIYVKKGESVQSKQKIGKLSTGEGGSSSLNFQVWKDKEKQNPEWWLSK